MNKTGELPFPGFILSYACCRVPENPEYSHPPLRGRLSKNCLLWSPPEAGTTTYSTQQSRKRNMWYIKQLETEFSDTLPRSGGFYIHSFRTASRGPAFFSLKTAENLVPARGGDEILVPAAGLEPARLSARDFKSRMSADSIMPAFRSSNHFIMNLRKCQ